MTQANSATVIADAASIAPGSTNLDRIMEVLGEQVARPATGWSCGSFGAIIEFRHDRGEELRLTVSDDKVHVATGRGGLSVSRHPAMQAIAYEVPSSQADGWMQAVAICLPEEIGAMNGRTVLTEIGPDDEALRPEDRGAILFDLGLDLIQADFCIRTASPELIAILRGACGRPVFEHGNDVMRAIVDHSPHRVALSRVGRGEVYQHIPQPGQPSPDGPHTHVLPDLLKHRRTHAATTPLPDHLVPCVTFYPGNPLRDAFGKPIPFSRPKYDAYQHLFREFGRPDLLALKTAAWQAMEQGQAAAGFAVPTTRAGRAALRIAIRQAAQVMGDNPVIPSWRQRFDKDE